MYFHQLKIRIGATVFLAVVVSMVLIAAVCLLLMYQYQIQQRVENIGMITQGFKKEILAENKSVTMGDASIALQRMKFMIGDDCIKLSYYPAANPSGLKAFSEDFHLRNLALEAVRTHKIQIRTQTAEDWPFLIFSKTIFIGVPLGSADVADSRAGGIGAIISTSGLVHDLWEKQKIVFTYILLNGIIISTLVFFRLRKVLFDPVEHLVHLAENYQVAEGGGLFPESTDNEFGQLHKAMNSMVQRIEEDRGKLFQTVDSLEDANKKLQKAQDDVVRAEKMAAAGRLSAGLAHEIGNPVTIVQGYLELLQDRDIEDEERKEFVRRGLNELTRIDRLLQQLLDLTRTPKEALETVTLGRLLSEVHKVLHIPFAKKGISYSLSCPEEDLYIWGDREQLRQVLLNLLLNAMDALDMKNLTSKEVEKSISVILYRQEEEEAVVVEVHDNGIGIPKSDIGKIFEPFFTSKEPGKGTGLGLAVSYRFIEKLGGRLEVESEQGKGSVFRIILPLSVQKRNLYGDEA
jgi:signal transduction histidine kinase